MDDSLVELRLERPRHGVVVRMTVWQARISVVWTQPFEHHWALRLTRQLHYLLLHETQLHTTSSIWLVEEDGHDADDRESGYRFLVSRGRNLFQA